jgi:NADPH:quinone reductase-like Zn-dependent oxidoreductase
VTFATFTFEIGKREAAGTTISGLPVMRQRLTSDVLIEEQVRQWGGDRVILQGDNLHKDIEDALDGKKLSLVLDMVGGTPVGELAKSLKPGGSIVVYALQSGQFPAIPPGDLIYRGLSLHGFWLINWIRNAPRTEIKEIYQKLGDLVAGGSLSAAVEHVYPLDPHQSFPT